MLSSSLIRTQTRAFSVSRQVLAKKTKESAKTTTTTKPASKVTKSKKTSTASISDEIKETKKETTKAKNALKVASKEIAATGAVESQSKKSAKSTASTKVSKSKKTSTTNDSADVKIKETKKETTKAKNALKTSSKKIVATEAVESKSKESVKSTKTTKPASKVSKAKKTSTENVTAGDKIKESKKAAKKSKNDLTKISEEIKPLTNLAWPSPRCTLYPMKGQNLSSVVVFDPNDVPDYRVLFSIKNLQLGEKPEKEIPSLTKISDEIKPLYNLAWPSPRCTLYPMKGQYLSSVVVFDPKNVPDYKVLFSIKNLQLAEAKSEEKSLNVQEIQTERRKIEPEVVEDSKALEKKETITESTKDAPKPLPQISDHVKNNFPQKADDEVKPSVEPVPLEQRSHFVQSKLKEAELQDATKDPSAESVTTDTHDKTEEKRHYGNTDKDLILMKNAVDFSKNVINEAKGMLGKLLKI